MYEAAVLENGQIGKPINLGPNVNSSFDEKYPFFSSDKKYLYFSSNGHSSKGGYDVFRAAYTNSIFSQPVSLGDDINSKGDEIAFILSSPTKGYITSNKNALGNFDIFHFEIVKEEVLPITYTTVEELSAAIVPDANIEVKNEFGTLVLQTKSNNNGEFKLNLDPFIVYTVFITKEGYEDKTSIITSGDNFKSITLKKDNTSIPNDKTIDINTIEFDFNKAIIKDEYISSLDEIVTILNKNSETRLIIDAHTDNKGSNNYNKKLSVKRAKATLQYLIENGVSTTRLSYNAFGESSPLEKCKECTPEQDQKNRRVEFRLMNL